MKKRNIYLVYLLVMAFLSIGHSAKAGNTTPKPARPGTPFVDGDRVCFVGDSITHYGFYPRIIAAYYVTRYPDKSFRFFNCGIGSERLRNMNNRFEKDVLSKKPTYIAVMSGMNDSYCRFYDQPDRIEAEKKKMYQRFVTELKRFVEKVAAYKPRGAALIFSSPYDETAKLPKKVSIGKNDLMIRFGAYIKELSEEQHLHFVDFSTPMLAINRERQVKDSGFSICGPGRVHPGWPGHTVMAYHFLKSQGVEQYVASVALDHQKRNVREVIRCRVDGLKFTATGVSYTYHPKSLPFPLIDESHDGSFEDGLGLVPFEEDLNKEVIQITGLKGTFDLYINEEKIRESIDGRDLAKGINIGFNVLTPQQKKSQGIWAILRQAFQKELAMRGAAGLAYRDLPRARLSQNSPRKEIEAFIAKWANTEYKKRSAQAYWDIYHLGKADQRMAEFEAFFEKIDKINQPGSYQVKIVKHSAGAARRLKR